MQRINPWYITGLVEGEGCFSVSFSLRRKLNVGIETRPSFSISMNERDLELLKEVKRYFGCGAIRYSRQDRTYKFEVRSVRDLKRKVLKHFDRFPLQGSKAGDYEKFREIVIMVSESKHLSRKYLRRIIRLAYSMNPSGKRRYREEELLKVLGEVKV